MGQAYPLSRQFISLLLVLICYNCLIIEMFLSTKNYEYY